MNNQQSLADMEADSLAWLSVSTAALSQANEHSHEPVPPVAQSQVQRPAQLPGAPLRHSHYRLYRNKIPTHFHRSMTLPGTSFNKMQVNGSQETHSILQHRQ